MTKNENEAIQFMIWKAAHGFNGRPDGFSIQKQKQKWTPKRLGVLWLKYLKENKMGD